MLFSEVVHTSSTVAATRSRRKKSGAIAALLQRVTPPEIRIVVSYLSGELPQGRIGLGYSAVGQIDAGATLDEPSLSLAEVDARFTEIAETTGQGSAGQKKLLLGQLLTPATEPERAFLKGLVLGEVRQGALEGVMIDALATAFSVEAARVRRATMLAGAIPPVAEAIGLEGAAGLDRFALQLFVPVLPMLAHPAKGTEAVLERLGTASFEAKVDGARVQAHKDGQDVRLYTRGLNDITDRIPEIAHAVRSLPFKQAILDGEAIALAKDGSPLPFQTTMRRLGRTSEVEAMRREVPITTLFFDVLLADDETLLDAPTRRRIEVLESAVPVTGRVARCITDDVDEAEAFFGTILDQGHEGLMAKALDAPYEAGSRGKAWVKIKPAHTLDLVVLAAEWGSGRRKGWLSNLHLGARDPSNGGFVMLGKTFKGMTDEMLTWQTEALRTRALGAIDEWVVPVRPELVVEIAYSDLQISHHYLGGLALRFARVKRYRTDKVASDADTIETVRSLAAGGRDRR